jgi:hypothetical protein
VRVHFGLAGIEEATATISAMRQKPASSDRKNLQRKDRVVCLATEGVKIFFNS